MLSKKKIGFFCLLGISLLALVFHSYILTQVAAWSLQAYTISKWGATLQYDTLTLEGTHLTLVKPRLEGPFSFEAKELRIDLQWDWQERALHPLIDIEAPRLHLTKAVREKGAAIPRLEHKQKWLTIHPGFQMREGELNGVQFDLAFDSTKGGEATFYFGGRHSPDNRLLIKTSRGSSGLEITCTCRKVDAPSLLAFVQPLLSPHYPWLTEIELKGGVYDALLEADLTPHGLSEVRLKHFQAQGLYAKLKPWGTSVAFNKVQAFGKGHLDHVDIWNSLQGKLHLEDGKVILRELSSRLPLTDIQADLHVQQGSIDHSLITLQVAGLKGKMDIEWGDAKRLLTFKLDGIVEDLADIFPKFLQEGLKQHFYHNRLTVLANVKNLHQKIDLGGTVHVQRGGSDETDVVHFGCEFTRNPNGFGRKFAPAGWFYANKLPLEKFLSPFLFRNGQLHMEGEGEFRGSFDDQILTIKYDVDDLKLENEDLRIEAKHLHASLPGQLNGSHQFNFRTFDHQGSLPIQQTSYLEKNSGLVFEDIQGVVLFDNQLIRLRPLEGYCEGIFLAGGLEMDYADPRPGVFTLNLHFPTISGKISRIQRLLNFSHLKEIPLEGEFFCKDKGLNIHLDFAPRKSNMQATLRGEITEGSLPLKGMDMDLKGLYMDVSYDHQTQVLALNDIQGTLLVGKSPDEECQFLGDYIRFRGLQNPDIDFDIAVHDHQDELLRLVGHSEEGVKGGKNFVIDQTLTHLSAIVPENFDLQIKEGSQVEAFAFTSQFALKPLLSDLVKFKQSGFLIFSPSWIEKLTPMDGKGSIAMHRLPDKSYAFQLEGISQEHTFFLKGSLNDQKWMLDQLQWDDWKLYAELFQSENKWKIPFMGLSKGESLLLGLEGDFFPHEGVLHASLKYFDIKWDKGEKWDLLKLFSKNNFELVLSGKELKFSALSQHERRNFEILGRFDWPLCTKGELSLLSDSERAPLTFKWENRPTGGFAIRSIKGNFSGCDVDLIEEGDDSHLLGLKGVVAIDFNPLSTLLSHEIAENIKNLKIGSSYALTGKFWLDPEKGNSLLEKLYFKGNLASDEAILKGYQFQRIQADVQYVPRRLDMQNVLIQDPAGTAKMQSVVAMLDPQQERWSLFIPRVSVKNLSPALLRDTEGGENFRSTKFRSLLIKKIEMQDFYGDLSRTDNWEGKGSLHFTNPSRKNIFHPLFAIPGEILLRLGLDPNLLNPVTGTLSFNLQGDKFYLTKFKDVYSEGRGSKFYLAGGPTPSWMDLDGNLSVQIRMKQYNLIFKIAELFTVSIDGNIRKPQFHLQKQGQRTIRTLRTPIFFGVLKVLMVLNVLNVLNVLCPCT